jgi:hypothetical protein
MTPCFFHTRKDTQIIGKVSAIFVLVGTSKVYFSQASIDHDLHNSPQNPSASRIHSHDDFSLLSYSFSDYAFAEICFGYAKVFIFIAVNRNLD